MKEKFLAQAQSDLTQAFSDSAMASDPGNPTLVGEEISAQVVRSKQPPSLGPPFRPSFSVLNADTSILPRVRCMTCIL
jgi:hypothetical protein